MSFTLDAKAAAERIHLAVNAALATDHPSPEARHTAAFVTDVCGHLGIEANNHNLTIVTAELAKADIVPHVVQDYPKMIGRRPLLGSDKQPQFDEFGRPRYEDIIAHNEDDEKAWGAESRPMLGADQKPLLDAKGEPRTEQVAVRKDDAAGAQPLPVHVGGPYPKIVGRRRLFGTDGKSIRDQMGAERMQDVIVDNEDEENEYLKSIQLPRDAKATASAAAQAEPEKAA